MALIKGDLEDLCRDLCKAFRRRLCLAANVVGLPAIEIIPASSLAHDMDLVQYGPSYEILQGAELDVCNPATWLIGPDGIRLRGPQVVTNEMGCVVTLLRFTPAVVVSPATLRVVVHDVLKRRGLGVHHWFPEGCLPKSCGSKKRGRRDLLAWTLNRGVGLAGVAGLGVAGLGVDGGVGVAPGLPVVRVPGTIVDANGNMGNLNFRAERRVYDIRNPQPSIVIP